MNEWCSRELWEGNKYYSVTTEGEKQVVQGKVDAKLDIPALLPTFPNSLSNFNEDGDEKKVTILHLHCSLPFTTYLHSHYFIQLSNKYMKIHDVCT